MLVVKGQEYLSSEETCMLLGVKAATLYTYVSRKVLDSYQQGKKRQRLYKRSQVEALLELRPSGSSQPGNYQEAEASEQQHPQSPLAESWIPYS